MGAKLNGHTTWAAKAEKRREAETNELYETYQLKPDDVVRFPKSSTNSAKVQGKPMYVSADGSITCSAGGKMRSILPEKIEVKTKGPRGGTVWVSLTYLLKGD